MYVKPFCDVFIKLKVHTNKVVIKLNLKIEVGKKLKEARKIAGYTQKQVADKLLMTQQQYSRFENGVFELNYEQLAFLCKLYDVSSDYLLGIDIY